MQLRRRAVYFLLCFHCASTALAEISPVTQSGGNINEFLPRCRTYDSVPAVARAGWPRLNRDPDTCYGWTGAPKQVFKAIGEECFLKPGQDTVGPLYEAWKSYNTGKVSTWDEWFKSMGNIPIEAFVPEDGLGAVDEIKKKLVEDAWKCAVISAVRIMPGKPSSKETMLKAAEGGITAFDTFTSIKELKKNLQKTGTKLQDLSRQFRESEGFRDGVRAAGKLGAASTSVAGGVFKNIVDRSNKFYQTATAIDAFVLEKMEQDLRGLIKSIEECKPVDAENRIGPIEDQIVGLMKEMRTDMVFIEHEGWCREEWRKQSNMFGRFGDHGTQAAKWFFMSNYNQRRVYYDGLNRQQCSDAGARLAKLQEIRDDGIQKLVEEKQSVYDDFTRLSSQLRNLRRDCTLDAEEARQRNRDENEVVAKLQDLTKKRCGKDLDIDELLAAVTPTSEELAKLADARRNIEDHFRRCRPDFARSAKNTLVNFEGAKTHLLCPVKRMLHEIRFDERIAELDEDVGILDDLLARAPTSDMMWGHIRNGCGFDAAAQAVDAFRDEWNGVSFKNASCRGGTKAKQINARIRSYDRELEAEAEKIVVAEEAFIKRLDGLLEQSRKYLGWALEEQEGARRCELLAQCVENSSNAAKLIPAHQHMVWCTDLPQGTEDRRLIANKQVDDCSRMVGDSSVLDPLIAEANALIDQECELGKVEDKIVEVEAAASTLCNRDWYEKVTAVWQKKAALEGELKGLGDTVKSAKRALDEAVTSCSAEGIENALAMVGGHACLRKLADPETKQQLVEIDFWQGSPEAIRMLQNSVREKLARARTEVEGCYPGRALETIAEAEKAVSDLRNVHPNCDAIVPEVGQLAALRVQAQQRKELLAAAQGDLSARVALLESSVGALENEIAKGSPKTEAARQQVLNRIADLRYSAEAALSDTSGMECDEVLADRVRRVLQMIAALYVPDAEDSSGTVVASGDDQGGDDDDDGGSDAGGRDPYGDPGYPGDDEELGGLLDGLTSDAVDSVNQDGRRTEQARGRVGGQVSNAGAGADRQAGGWTPPRTTTWGETTEAVNQGRRRRGGRDAYGQGGVLIEPPRPRPRPRPRRRGGCSSGGCGGGNSHGSSETTRPPRGTSSGHPLNDPPVRDTRGSSSNSQCKSRESDCLAKARKAKQDSIEMFKEFNQQWTAKDEREHQKMVSYCKSLCAEEKATTDAILSGGVGNLGGGISAAQGEQLDRCMNGCISRHANNPSAMGQCRSRCMTSIR